MLVEKMLWKNISFFRYYSTVLLPQSETVHELGRRRSITTNRICKHNIFP